ncbi:hypothetical protein [Longitalea luteola]|uniref:hypothetical protein n=1 Tax=Longitalea luteola TaxID=2812563 RepID=UPI001A95A2DF|nr:hypothetical protein [Longitalea luteola]
MKKVIFLGAMATVLAFAACKNDGKKEETNEATGATQTAATSEEQKPAAANQPKEYNVTATPDTAILGKKKEALVKVNGATAMALTDPDGKDNGIELVLKLTLTNKQQIGEGNGVFMDYTKSRLQLDNGTNITCDNATDHLRAEPEATSKQEEWTYKIPAGAKPTALNLFMNDTRVSLGVALSDK